MSTSSNSIDLRTILHAGDVSPFRCFGQKAERTGKFEKISHRFSLHLPGTAANNCLRMIDKLGGILQHNLVVLLAVVLIPFKWIVLRLVGDTEAQAMALIQ
jgi:hypothetical protein